MATDSRHHAPAASDLAASQKTNYVCPTCEKAFKRPSTLNEHIRATHTTDRLICNHCGKAFRRANDLKRHEKLHSGEKSYSCLASTASSGTEVGCGKRFARLHSLKEHQRRRIGTTCWDAFVESQSQAQSRAPSPRSMPAYDDSHMHTSAYHDGGVIHQSIEVDTAPQPERPSYKPIDWLNWSMQPRPPAVTCTARPVRAQPIMPSDISWHSVLESRLRHDAESIIASSRNSSFSSMSSASSYPVSTSA